MKNSYKYFKENDKIISVKSKKSFRFYQEALDDKPKLFKIYTFDRYITSTNYQKYYQIFYNLLIVKENLNNNIYYDGCEFISLSEYRKLKLQKLKRKSFFKNFFKKINFIQK